MGRSDEDEEYVTYTIVTCPEMEALPADTAKIKIPKFYGGTAKSWLKWNMRFKSLVARKHRFTEQAASQLMILIEGELGQDVQKLARQAVEANASFEDFHDQIGMLMVPGDFSEDLDEELLSLTKQRDETVQALSRRSMELVRPFT